MTTAEAVFDRAQALPEPLARELLDFAEFLLERTDRSRHADLMAAQASSMAGVWDNDDDDVYNYA